MSGMLRNDPNVADALLDMSNVLRNTKLDRDSPADLVRLVLVGQALAALYGAAKIAMFGVADRSLLTRSGLFPDPGQRRTLRDWADAGLILVAGKADIPLLQIAAETGLERHRFTVTEDEPLFAGRFPGPTDLSPFLDETARRRVSRAHLGAGGHGAEDPADASPGPARSPSSWG